MAQRLHTDRGPHKVTLTPMFCREIIIRLMNMSMFPLTAMYYSPPAKLVARALKPKFSHAALRLIASKPPLKMWVVKKN